MYMAQFLRVLFRKVPQSVFGIDQLHAQGVVRRCGFDVVVGELFARQIARVHVVHDRLVNACLARRFQKVVTERGGGQVVPKARGLGAG